MLTPVETIQTHGCTITMRRLDGPVAREIYLSAQPSGELGGPKEQAAALYDAIQTVLAAHGGSATSIVSETIFYRNAASDASLIRAARDHSLRSSDGLQIYSALCEIEQASLDDHVSVEVSLQAVVSTGHIVETTKIACSVSCKCDECVRFQGVKISLDDETRFYSGGVYGTGSTAYEQTTAMFDAAEVMLENAGMQFSDVVRTWIYLPHMERDYADLNSARREFFKTRGIQPPPASTGIGAGLVPDQHDLCLCVYAVKKNSDGSRVLMTTPTLNEAASYGADFSRGMRVEEANKRALYVSGTASLDETGTTVHVGDFEAQVDRMLLNVRTLLKEQQADFADVVSAVTYLKHAKDKQQLIEKMHEAGYQGFAHTLVIAPVCRPELLCETEAFAVQVKT